MTEFERLQLAFMAWVIRRLQYEAEGDLIETGESLLRMMELMIKEKRWEPSSHRSLELS